MKRTGGGMRRWFFLFFAAVLCSATTVFSQQTTIERRYVWEYGERTWSLTHHFSAFTYRFFSSLPRTLNYMNYGLYACDPRDDEELQSLIIELEALAADARLNVWEKLNLIIAFVQSIPYATEEGEYPRYPVETLVETQKDCEDAAILIASLLQRMGFGVVLLAFIEEQHMAVGIRVLPPEGSNPQTYEWDGDIYCFLEPTSTGWKIGEIPEAYVSQPTIVALQPTFASHGR